MRGPAEAAPRQRVGHVLTALVAVAVPAVVLWRYQAVDSPEPLARLLACALWMAVLLAAWWGAGGATWRLVGGGRGEAPRVVVLMLGVAALAGWSGLLGAFGWLSPRALAVGLGLAAVAGVLRWRPGPARCAVTRVPLQAALLAAVGLATFLALPALSPQYDAWHYHLAFPFRWLAAGSISVEPRHAYSALPATAGLLYAYALALLGPWAAQALNWLLGAVAVLGVGELGARLGGRRAGAWAAAALATTPAAMSVSTWSGADLATVAFAVAAAAAVVPGRHGAELRSLAGAGLLVGCAVGCKLVAGLTVALPVAVLAAAAPPRAGVERRILRVAVVAAGAVVAYLPWAVRAAIAFGDPLYPYLGHLLGSGTAAPAVVAGLGGFGRGAFDPVAVLTLRTFDPRGEAGLIGPLWLAAAPLALWAAARDRTGRCGALLLAAVAGVAGWAATPQLGRYLLPVLGLAAAPVAAGWTRLLARLRRGPARWLVLCLAALVLLWGAQGGLTPEGLERAGATLGRGDGRAILERSVSVLPAVDWINAELPAGARVLLVGESRSFGIERQVVVEDPFRTPLLVELARAEPGPEAIARRLRGEGVTHLLLNRHEADRIARLNGRERYLGPLTATERERLQQFLQRWCTPLVRVGAVTVLRLDAAAGGQSGS